MTLLRRAASLGNIEIIKAILDDYPESDRLRAVNLKDKCRRNVSHHVARSGNVESLNFILSLYTESEEQLQSVRTKVSFCGTL